MKSKQCQIINPAHRKCASNRLHFYSPFFFYTFEWVKGNMLVEENQERCVSDTDSEGIRRISIEERTAADFKGKIFCPYSHDGHSARVEMELRHCHTTSDRDAWYPTYPLRRLSSSSISSSGLNFDRASTSASLQSFISRHCHTTADRDAWYECPVCGACSPTASAGTFDENSVEAYRLASRLSVQNFSVGKESSQLFRLPVANFAESVSEQGFVF